MIFLKYIPSFLFLIFYIDVIAQQYNFINYSIEDGLPQSQVHAIFQDSRGNMWFGTAGGGACRFDGKNFKVFTTENGLSSNQIVTIHEDTKGNLWFGTYGGGLCKYDGWNFSYFTEDDGLGSNDVNDIFEDKNGNLWIATRGGITVFDGKSFRNFTVDDGLISNSVNSIVQDTEGNIWIATHAGISKYDPSAALRTGGQTFTGFTMKKNGLVSDDVSINMADNSGNIWFGTPDGVIKYNGNDFINYTEEDGLDFSDIRSIIEDDYGNIWFGSYSGGGLYKYNTEHDDREPKTSNTKKFIKYNSDNGLCKDIILALFIDKAGFIWIGTDGGGVCKFDGGVFTQYTTHEGLSYNHVSSIYEDNSGKIWFGTYGYGVNIYNPDAKDGSSFTQPGLEWASQERTVLSIVQDGIGNYWFGSVLGIVCKYNGGNTKHYAIASSANPIGNYIFSAVNDKKGNLWFGIRGGGIVKYDGNVFTTYTQKDGLASNLVTTVIVDRSGNIWAGTEDNGISVLKFGGKAQNNFTNYTTADGLCSNRILSLAEDSKGRIWIGTDGGGISCFDRENSRYITINKRNGLDNNRVFLLIDYKDDNQDESEQVIWAGTQTGVNKITMDNNNYFVQVRQYGKVEGFKGVECNRNAVIQDHEGNVWFGTFDGVVKYDPKLDKYNASPPQLHIQGVRLFFENVKLEGIKYTGVSKWYHLPQNLILPYDKNHITIDYIGISRELNAKVRYRFKLEGLSASGGDDRWSPVTKLTESTYSNLPPGEYIFKVLSSVTGGKWNDSPAEFRFTITPAFWQTWWFYSICIVGGIGLFMLMLRYRTIRLQSQRKKLHKMVQQRTEELRLLNENLEKMVAERTKELDNFIYRITHDIKSPLNSILGISNVVKVEAKAKDQEIRSYMDMIDTSANHLQNLINDLLLVTMVKKGTVEYTAIDFDKLISDILGQLAHVDGFEEVSFNRSFEHKKEFRSDRNILQSVMQNLIENAIKYRRKTPEGSFCHIQTRDDDNGIIIEVSDNGIGIPESLCERIFEVLFRVESEIPGTGLGLYIIKTAIDKLNGTIELKSVQGSGTTFTICLPVNH